MSVRHFVLQNKENWKKWSTIIGWWDPSFDQWFWANPWSIKMEIITTLGSIRGITLGGCCSDWVHNVVYHLKDTIMVLALWQSHEIAVFLGWDPNMWPSPSHSKTSSQMGFFCTTLALQLHALPLLSIVVKKTTQ